MGRAATGAVLMVFTHFPALIMFGLPEKRECGMVPDDGKIIAEDIAEIEFRHALEQIAGIDRAIRHDGKLSHASCAAHAFWQGIFFKAGCVHPIDLHPAVPFDHGIAEAPELDEARGIHPVMRLPGKKIHLYQVITVHPQIYQKVNDPLDILHIRPTYYRLHDRVQSERNKRNNTAYGFFIIVRTRKEVVSISSASLKRYPDIDPPGTCPPEFPEDIGNASVRADIHHNMLFHGSMQE